MISSEGPERWLNSSRNDPIRPASYMPSATSGTTEGSGPTRPRSVASQ
ncbi:hypothetical protein [Actinacidiphila yeochonensis]|nr:hypothetical protein [Actinacidiphila yeochonensis]